MIPKLSILSQFYCSPWLWIYQLYHKTLINQCPVPMVYFWILNRNNNFFMSPVNWGSTKRKMRTVHEGRFLYPIFFRQIFSGFNWKLKTHMPKQVFGKIKTQNYHKAQMQYWSTIIIIKKKLQIIITSLRTFCFPYFYYNQELWSLNELGSNWRVRSLEIYSSLE